MHLKSLNVSKQMGAASSNCCYGGAVERRFLKPRRWTSKSQQRAHGKAPVESIPSSAHCSRPASRHAQVLHRDPLPQFHCTARLDLPSLESSRVLVGLLKIRRWLVCVS